jgi:hypothetical protein
LGNRSLEYGDREPFLCAVCDSPIFYQIQGVMKMKLPWLRKNKEPLKKFKTENGKVEISIFDDSLFVSPQIDEDETVVKKELIDYKSIRSIDFGPIYEKNGDHVVALLITTNDLCVFLHLIIKKNISDELMSILKQYIPNASFGDDRYMQYKKKGRYK